LLGRPFESWLRDHTELSMGSFGSYVANCKRLEQAGTKDILPPSHLRSQRTVRRLPAPARAAGALN